MKNYTELEEFIKTNRDWERKLKPWLKSVRYADFNPNWACIMYNLMNLPEDPAILKVICQARGTVVNVNTGEIICAPFVKFWNFGVTHLDIIETHIPNDFEIV